MPPKFLVNSSHLPNSTISNQSAETFGRHLFSAATVVAGAPLSLPASILAGATLTQLDIGGFPNYQAIGHAVHTGITGTSRHDNYSDGSTTITTYVGMDDEPFVATFGKDGKMTSLK